MLTLFTQASIALLLDISTGNDQHSRRIILSEEIRSSLLAKLEAGGLIQLISKEEKSEFTSYQLCRSLESISLLDILQVLEEPIDCTQPTYWIETSHSIAKQKLGTLNLVIRRFCSEIKIIDW